MAFYAFALGVFLFIKPVFGVTLILSDFDDTIVETRRHESYGGTFSTKYILFQIQNLGSVIIPRADEPKTVEVTPHEFERIKNILGEGEEKPGSIKETITLESGQVIHPGYYHIRNPETFRYYRESPPDQNYLLEDFKEAEKREPKEGFKGPFWDSMVEILSTEAGAKSFGIISARGASIREWKELFEYMQKKKYIEWLPNFGLFRSVTRPEYEKYDIKGNVSQRKAALMNEMILGLRFQPLTDSDKRLAPDGKTVGQYHSVLFADDKKETVDLVTDLFLSLSRSQIIPNVKFGLFNAGVGIRTKRERFGIIKDTGTIRSAVENEIIKDAGNCALSIAG